MSFTDQRQRIATEGDLRLEWGFGKPGERFRCYLCGLRFKVGDKWRWVAATHLGVSNFITCDGCDGLDVRERFIALNEEFKERFWWVR